MRTTYDSISIGHEAPHIVHSENRKIRPSHLVVIAVLVASTVLLVSKGRSTLAERFVHHWYGWDAEVFDSTSPLVDQVHDLPKDYVRSQAAAVRVLQIAVAYDTTLCIRFKNSTVRASAHVQSLMNKVSAIYERDIGIRLSLTHLEPHCNLSTDPYQYQDHTGGYMLRSVRDYWVANRANVNRDVMILFTGYADNSSRLGVAYVGAACSKYWGYTWVEGAFGKVVPVLAHELGHLLNARHVDTGIMAAYFSGSQVFNSTSVDQIKSYLNTSQSSCINSEQAQCDVSCPGCTSKHCIPMYDDFPASVTEGLEPCVIQDGNYKCVDTSSTGWAGGKSFHPVQDCPSGYDFMSPLETNSANRLNVFCCTTQANTIGANVSAVPTAYNDWAASDKTQEGTFMQGTLARSCRS